MAIMDVNEFIKMEQYTHGKMHTMFSRAIMKDGYSISIQANFCTYCSPRVTGADEYEEVELGFPNKEDPVINDYAEDNERYTKTVYGYVPIKVVNELIAKHGGIINYE